MIKILEASAGSGKTYNLALTYIKLLLQSEESYAYRHILAVTFTNKATAEMKDRILRELAKIAADPYSSPYLDDLVPDVCKDPQELQKRCARLLPDILHDYSAFSVSTIDKFFQRTLKAFAREIGYYASYQVELDRDSLIQETVDRMLDAMTESDTALLGYLTDSVQEQIEQGRKARPEDSIQQLGSRIKSHEFQSLVQSSGVDVREAYSKGSVQALRKCCRGIMIDFASSLRQFAKDGIKALLDYGMAASDSSRGSLVVLEEWASIKDDALSFKQPTESFLSKCGTPEEFFRKADRARAQAAVDGGLGAALAHIADLVTTKGKDYSTADIILKSSVSLGLVRDFMDAFQSLVREKNIMSLDDANTILRRIIDGSDAPFIYERMGVRYEHFLLDEFQDTSTVQWDNFRPLLRESDAYGRDNLVVGDVKQSIYRWRGSQWHLLSDDLPREFPDAQRKALEFNFRSLREVVGFNNSFFTELPRWLDAKTGLSGGGSISDIYKDVVQKPRTRDDAPGYVRLEFVAEDTQEEAVLRSIARAREAGAAYKDIAVLVRKHKPGGQIASALIAKGIPVVTDDSLKVRSSVTVRRLLSLLSCVNNPADSLSGYMASLIGIEYPEDYHSLLDLCESLLRALRRYDAAIFDGEVLYIQTFMDVVQEWSANNGNALPAFLKYWEESEGDGESKKGHMISSPEDADAVTIMTIHKSKGLQFPYVICPYVEQIGRHTARDNTHWCMPEIAGGPLKAFADRMYPVSVSGKLAGTAFESSMKQEVVEETVDDINMMYVAFTRAEKVLHVISEEPAGELAEKLKAADTSAARDLSHYLYAYAQQFGDEFGSPYDFRRMKRREDPVPVQAFTALYPSIPMVTEESPDEEIGVGERSRLKFSSDAADFFGADGTVSMEASPRLGGIVKHEILSRIDSVAQLRSSVDFAVQKGQLTAQEGDNVYSELLPKVQEGVSLGWFSEDGPGEITDNSARNEVSLIDTDGSVYRPDRVVLRGGSVDVIDYKFGDPHPSYLWQVRRYMRLYRQMGYKQVRGWLWYVRDGLIEEVSAHS